MEDISGTWRFPHADPVDRNGKTLVMGILNMTPDSFSGRNGAVDEGRAVDVGLRLLEEGADVLDIGAESSRPGAEPLSAEEEMARLGGVVGRLRGQTRRPISVDTYHARTAGRVLEQGADMINDITALRGGWGEGVEEEGEMGRVVSGSGAHVVLMHMPCSPLEMGGEVEYRGGVVGVVREFLERRVMVAEGWGIGRERLWVDVGFGFGKNFEQNRELLVGMGEVCGWGVPVLAGLSRKRMVGEVLGVGVEGRVVGSLVLGVMAVLRGAGMLRVHDVRETVEALAVLDAVK